jgi:hypothetical protein
VPPVNAPLGHLDDEALGCAAVRMASQRDLTVATRPPDAAEVSFVAALEIEDDPPVRALRLRRVDSACDDDVEGMSSATVKIESKRKSVRMTFEAFASVLAPITTAAHATNAVAILGRPHHASREQAISPFVPG